MKPVRTVLVLMALFVAGSLLAREVAVDYDATVDFSKYKTFAWKVAAQAPNPSTHQRIVGAVEKELAAKGLKKVEKDPDLWVSYSVVVKKEATSTDWDYGKFKFSGRDVTYEKLARGTLVVDLIDGKGANLLWRGEATENIQPDAPPGEGVIEKGVALMFKDFPPKKGK